MNICAHTGLANAIEAEMKSGPIPFRRFMELALYHPEGGYYRRARPSVGREGDFKTSPHQSPWFGRMVARQAGQIWEAMGGPGDFPIFEAGPGEGWLAHDILEAAGPIADSLEYILAEQSPAARERMTDRLARWMEGAQGSPRARLADSSELPEGFEGLALAHEFLDALPVHILIKTGGKLMERHVALEGETLSFCEGPLSDPRLEGWLEGLGAQLEEGQTAEVCPAAMDWTKTAGKRLKRGGVLIFDYGFSSGVLYHPSRREGTIRGYRGHAMTDDPLERPGECDLTAHVDFTSVLKAAESSGLRLAGFTDQAHFLLGIGISEALERTSANVPETASGGRGGFRDNPQLTADRRRAMGLLDPGGLGGAIKVMLLTKGLDDSEFSGFSMKPDDRESLATLRG